MSLGRGAHKLSHSHDCGAIKSLITASIDRSTYDEMSGRFIASMTMRLPSGLAEISMRGAPTKQNATCLTNGAAGVSCRRRRILPSMPSISIHTGTSTAASFCRPMAM